MGRLYTVALALAFVLPLSAQPAFGLFGVPSLQNAASLEPMNVTGLVPGQLFFAEVVLYTDLLTPSDVSLTIVDGSGRARPIELSVYQETRLLGRIPADLVGTTAKIQRTYPNGTSNTDQYPVMHSAFGLFSRWNTGKGPASAQQARFGGVGINSITTPASPGDFITVYGTALGDATVQAIIIDGKRVPVSFFGPAPGMPGVEQVNFRIPAGIRGVCYVPVQAETSAGVSNVVTISVAGSGGTCEHLLPLTAAEKTRLASGGTVVFATGDLRSSRTDSILEIAGLSPESASLLFWDADARSIDAYSAPLQETPASECSSMERPARGLFGVFLPSGIDAGDVVLRGPAGVQIPLNTTSADSGYYGSSPLPSSLSGGAWTFAATGGSDVSPFSTTLQVPYPLTWWLSSPVDQIPRRSNLQIAWTTADRSDQDVVTVTISYPLYKGSPGFVTITDIFNLREAAVICRAPSNAGLISVPADLLSQTPDSASLTIELAPRPDRTPVFHLQSPGGQKSGAGFLTYSRSEQRTVRFQ